MYRLNTIYMKRFLLYTPIFLVFASCTKHAGDILPQPGDAAKAILRVAQPTAGGVYRNGDTVWIRAEAVAPANIHGYELSIRRPDDTTRVYYAHIHEHNDTLQIDQYWVNDRTNAQDLELEISLALDHGDSKYIRRIPFHVQ
jgi:hypothetical protein